MRNLKKGNYWFVVRRFGVYRIVQQPKKTGACVTDGSKLRSIAEASLVGFKDNGLQIEPFIPKPPTKKEIHDRVFKGLKK